MSKVSEISTADAAKAIAAASGPMARIIEDPAVLAAMRETLPHLKGLPFKTQAVRLALGVLPALLDSHADDTFALLGLIAGKDAKAMMEQPASITAAFIADLIIKG